MTKKDILNLETVASVNVYGGLEIKKKSLMAIMTM